MTYMVQSPQHERPNVAALRVQAENETRAWVAELWRAMEQERAARQRPKRERQ